MLVRSDSCRSHRFVLVTLILVGLAAPAGAQIPEEFTNLEILPKDISRGELVGIMRDFAGALGVRCIHCHVGDDPNSLEGIDFASDERRAKRTARVMMQMVEEINTTLLPKIGKESPREVGCVTCHHGLEHPETLEQVLTEAIEKGGADEAIARYRELREEYYGRGAYDFSHRTLRRLAGDLMGGDNLDAALAIAELDLEYHHDIVAPYMTKAEIHARRDELPAARAALEKALELDPENHFVKQMLERLKTPEEPSE